MSEGATMKNALKDRTFVELTRAFLQSSPIPTLVIDDNHVITHWNRAVEIFTGITAGEMIGTTDPWKGFYPGKRPILADLILDGKIDTAKELYRSGSFSKSAIIDGAFEAEGFFPNIGKEGLWLYFTAAPLRSDDGTIVGVVETLQDITERKNAEILALRLAKFDSLTGLPNRVEFAERIKNAFSWNRRHDSLMAIAYMDLDGFKPINDTYGHNVGDEVLREVAKRSIDHLRGYDTIARLGGDEFAILLSGVQDRDEAASILNRLVEALCKTIRVFGVDVHISASVGFCMHGHKEEANIDHLLRQSDQAMYVAKKSGKGRVCEFSDCHCHHDNGTSDDA